MNRTRQPARGGLAALLLAIAAAAPFAVAAQSPPAAAELQLDQTTITGSRELPTVLNILPWKRQPSSELRGAPEDSMLGEVLKPINRVEFRRELRYAAPPPAAVETPK